MKTLNTKIDILNAAQDLIQKRGYNGFSYSDIADIVGIRKASIHHHFPKKSQLVIAVIKRYRQEFNNELKMISTSYPHWQDKIHQYGKLYEDVLRQDKLCLCGMLASDAETLPLSIRKELSLFFNENVKWLADVIGTHHQSLTKKRLNQLSWKIISTFQGAIIMARIQKDLKILAAASHELCLSLSSI